MDATIYLRMLTGIDMFYLKAQYVIRMVQMHSQGIPDALLFTVSHVQHRLEHHFGTSLCSI